MARHDFTPAWLNFPSGSSPAKSYEKSLECVADCLDFQGDVSLRRHKSSEGTEADNGRTGGDSSRSERKVWKVRNNSEGPASCPPGPHAGVALRPKTKGLPEGSHQHRDKHFGAEDFPSLNPDAKREVCQNKALAAGVWEHPPNPQSRGSKMMVIKRVSKEEPMPRQQAPPRNGNGANLICGPVKSAGLPVMASSSGSLSPVDHEGQPRLMMRLSRMRTDKKSHFLKALKQDMAGEEDLHHLCKEDDDIHLQNINQLNQPSGEAGDRTRNGNAGTSSQENGNPIGPGGQQQPPCHSPFHQQDALLSSSLEAEHRLLREMGWQGESESDETCAPLTEEEMREFQAISEQLQRNGLRRNVVLKNGLSGDCLALWRTNNLHVDIAPAAEETETSSSDTSDDEA